MLRSSLALSLSPTALHTHLLKSGLVKEAETAIVTLRMLKGGLEVVVEPGGRREALVATSAPQIRMVHADVLKEIQ